MSNINNLPGLDKAAILFKVLGEALALSMFKNISEANLLKTLALNVTHVCNRIELAQACGLSGSDRSIDVQMTRLRRKIEPDPKNPRYLQTVRGHGYVLRPD